MNSEIQFSLGGVIGDLTVSAPAVRTWDDVSKLAVARKDHAEASIMESNANDRIQDRKQRQKFSDKIYYFMAAFVTAVLILVAFSQYLGLSDLVIVTLVTTSMTTVVGVFIFVAKYLFRMPDEKKG
jgi:hypothetical protein